jgi:hypothetical protein
MRLWGGLELDDMVFPDNIVGIEVYAGPARVPPEFNVTTGPSSGAACGAVVVWTK